MDTINTLILNMHSIKGKMDLKIYMPKLYV